MGGMGGTEGDHGDSARPWVVGLVGAPPLQVSRQTPKKRLDLNPEGAIVPPTRTEQRLWVTKPAVELRVHEGVDYVERGKVEDFLGLLADGPGCSTIRERTKPLLETLYRAAPSLFEMDKGALAKELFHLGQHSPSQHSHSQDASLTQPPPAPMVPGASAPTSTDQSRSMQPYSAEALRDRCEVAPATAAGAVHLVRKDIPNGPPPMGVLGNESCVAHMLNESSAGGSSHNSPRLVPAARLLVSPRHSPRQLGGGVRGVCRSANCRPSSAAPSAAVPAWLGQSCMRSEVAGDWASTRQ